jgi:hypothetical protein
MPTHKYHKNIWSKELEFPPATLRMLKKLGFYTLLNGSE